MEFLITLGYPDESLYGSFDLLDQDRTGRLPRKETRHRQYSHPKRVPGILAGRAVNYHAPPLKHFSPLLPLVEFFLSNKVKRDHRPSSVIHHSVSGSPSPGAIP